MRIDKEIIIYPPAFTDANGKLIKPKPITFSNQLPVSYIDSPFLRTVGATIQGTPLYIILAKDDEYSRLGDYTGSQIEYIFRQKLGDDPATFLRSQYARTLEEDPDGPGTILSNMLKYIGIKSSPNCSCRKRAIEMNERGPDWCDANRSTILGWLKEESDKRKIPFVESVASVILSRAIAISRSRLSKKQ